MITTREYQESGVKWLLQRKKAMLADEPGLGKTFQASEALERANAYPALVFCPSHLVKQWADWYASQYSHRSVSYAHKADFYLRDWALTKDADVYIANIEMLRRIDDYEWPRVKGVIFDESHHLKNRSSKQSQGALKIIFQSKPEYVFCLSATPIKREADDLFAQFRLMRPDIFSSYDTFVKTFCETENVGWEIKVVGVHNKNDLMKLLEVIMLRRHYSDVNMELPELIESIIPVEFNAAQRKAYDRLKNDLILSVGDKDEDAIPFMWAIQALQTLRKMTATDDKVAAAVAAAVEADRAVIFTHYRDIAQRIANQLDTKVINGDMPADERGPYAKSQTYVVATIDSITEGVDLSMFDTVIFAEEDYTSGTNEQALKRVWRYGAKLDKPIKKICVHVKDSIDETVHAISERRHVTAQSLLKDVLDLSGKQMAEVN